MPGSDVCDRIIVLDVGGTQFRVAVGTGSGAIEYRISQPTKAENGPNATLDRIFGAVDKALASVRDKGTVKGIAIGIAGPVDPWAGIVHTPPNLSGWDAMPVKQLFEERYGLSCRVANDANLAALGEHRFGAGKGFSDVVYVTISTGIGGGIIVGNRLLLGHGGYAGEIGHMVVDPNGPLCGCGNSGCWESLASGTAIARRARDQAALSKETMLRDVEPWLISAKVVIDLAQRGDAVSLQIVREAAVALGLGMVNLIHLFNPHRIVIGGGLGNAGPLIWEPMLETIRVKALPVCQRDLDLVQASLGDDAGLLGGVALTVPTAELDRCNVAVGR